MTRRYPLSRDGRYSVRQEYCGYSKPRWVARFMGDWLGQAVTKSEGQGIALASHERRFNTQTAQSQTQAVKA